MKQSTPQLLAPVLLTLLGLASTRSLPTVPQSTASQDTESDPLAWLEGRWVGHGFGGTVEEIWSPPVDGVRMCVFRLIVDGEVALYEIVTLAPTDTGHEMRLRHFDDQLHAWEERKAPLVWKVTQLGEDVLAAGPVTYEHDPEGGELRVFVQTSENPEPEELVLRKAGNQDTR